MKADEKDFLDPYRIRTVVKTYSDHIALPIRLEETDDKGEKKTETVNAASALWTRPKNEITAEQYKKFYQDVAHQFDDPWLTIHGKAEGTLEYTTLLFIPSTKPFDLFEVERKSKVKLYVRRVFITDEAPGLLPPYLRFIKGIVDSEDLPLNISREMLQNNPMLARMKSQIVKRVISELAKKAKDEPEEYVKFWDNLGAVLKEGLYEDYENRDALLPLLRFRSTAKEELSSLDDYVARMKPGQDAIYFITGDKLDTLREIAAARRLPRQGRRDHAADRSGRRVLAAVARRIPETRIPLGDARRARTRQDRDAGQETGRGEEGRDQDRYFQPDRAVQADAWAMRCAMCARRSASPKAPCASSPTRRTWTSTWNGCCASTTASWAAT